MKKINLREKKNEFIHNFKKSYYKPVSLPISKWIVIGLLLFCSILLYYVSWITFSLSPGYLKLIRFFPLISGICIHKAIFEILREWNTGSWKNAEKEQEYIKKYCNDEDKK